MGSSRAIMASPSSSSSFLLMMLVCCCYGLLPQGTNGFGSRIIRRQQQNHLFAGPPPSTMKKKHARLSNTITKVLQQKKYQSTTMKSVVNSDWNNTNNNQNNQQSGKRKRLLEMKLDSLSRRIHRVGSDKLGDEWKEQRSNGGRRNNNNSILSMPASTLGRRKRTMLVTAASALGALLVRPMKAMAMAGGMGGSSGAPVVPLQRYVLDDLIRGPSLCCFLCSLDLRCTGCTCKKPARPNNLPDTYLFLRSLIPCTPIVPNIECKKHHRQQQKIERKSYHWPDYSLVYLFP